MRFFFYYYYRKIIKYLQKRVKKDKIRPILLNKEKTPVADVTASNTLVNHFETIHPKDEFELLHAHQVSFAQKRKIFIKVD